MLSSKIFTVVLSSIILTGALPLPQFGNSNSGNGANDSGNSVEPASGGNEPSQFWYWALFRPGNPRNGVILANGGPTSGVSNDTTPGNEDNGASQQPGSGNSVNNDANTGGSNDSSSEEGGGPVTQAGISNPPNLGSNGASNDTGEVSNTPNGCLLSREPQFGNGVNGMVDCGNGGNNSGNGVAGSNSGNENIFVGTPDDEVDDVDDETE